MKLTGTEATELVERISERERMKRENRNQVLELLAGMGLV